MTKNKLIDDLKKYNRDLDKHFSELDFSSIDSVDVASSLYNDGEFHSIIAANLMDVKTEMGLMRRNLTSQIEGMVNRAIVKQQNEFMTQVNNVFGKATLDLKKNLSNQSKYFEDSMLQLRKEVALVNDFHDDFTKIIAQMKTEVSELKSCVDEFSEDIPQMRNSINNTLAEVLKKVTVLEEQNKRRSTHVENNLLTLNKKLIQIETNSKELGKKIEDNDYILQKKDTDIMRDIEDLNERILKMDTGEKIISSKLDGLSNQIRVPKEEISSHSKPSKNPVSKKHVVLHNQEADKFDKILEIESRIKKLDALR